MTETASTATQSADASLVAAARGGDHVAFARIVEQRLPATLRTALAILGNEADARDATQEIFVRAWRNLPGLRDPGSFEAWLGRITVNACRSAIRGRGRRASREISIDELGFRDPTRADAADAGLLATDPINRAMDRLTVLHRTLLALHYYEGRSLAQIGAMVGLPERTVKSRLFNARRALERELEAES